MAEPNDRDQILWDLMKKAHSGREEAPLSGSFTQNAMRRVRQEANRGSVSGLMEMLAISAAPLRFASAAGLAAAVLAVITFIGMGTLEERLIVTAMSDPGALLSLALSNI